MKATPEQATRNAAVIRRIAQAKREFRAPEEHIRDWERGADKAESIAQKIERGEK